MEKSPTVKISDEHPPPPPPTHMPIDHSPLPQMEGDESLVARTESIQSLPTSPTKRHLSGSSVGGGVLHKKYSVGSKPPPPLSPQSSARLRRRRRKLSRTSESSDVLQISQMQLELEEVGQWALFIINK